LFSPVQLQIWRATTCRLSATAYSVYSHLPSISGGSLLHPQHEDAPCRGDRDPLKARISIHKFLCEYFIVCDFIVLSVEIMFWKRHCFESLLLCSPEGITRFQYAVCFCCYATLCVRDEH